MYGSGVDQVVVELIKWQWRYELIKWQWRSELETVLLANSCIWLEEPYDRSGLG